MYKFGLFSFKDYLITFFFGLSSYRFLHCQQHLAHLSPVLIKKQLLWLVAGYITLLEPKCSDSAGSNYSDGVS